MVKIVNRDSRSQLQLGKLEATVWETIRELDPGRFEYSYSFTIDRLGLTLEPAHDYGPEETDDMIRLARWAEAQIHSFYEEWP